jgi:hypothetical protein
MSLTEAVLFLGAQILQGHSPMPVLGLETGIPPALSSSHLLPAPHRPTPHQALAFFFLPCASHRKRESQWEGGCCKLFFLRVLGSLHCSSSLMPEAPGLPRLDWLLRMAMSPAGRHKPILTKLYDNTLLDGFCVLHTTSVQSEMVMDPWGMGWPGFGSQVCITCPHSSTIQRAISPPRSQSILEVGGGGLSILSSLGGGPREWTSGLWEREDPLALPSPTSSSSRSRSGAPTSRCPEA